MAKASWFQITRKISGPEFRDLSTNVITIFQKANCKWKMFSSEMSNVCYGEKDKSLR
ncbi:MAG: hypothetical protein KJ915_01970 [Candidatus Omnitrophica bacterium]|nr:hypothetical protein [Candidatus Omnitrophota bacterium]